MCEVLMGEWKEAVMRHVGGSNGAPIWTEAERHAIAWFGEMETFGGRSPVGYQLGVTRPLPATTFLSGSPSFAASQHINPLCIFTKT